MKEIENILGTVVSTQTGPSPEEIEFVVTSGNAHRGQFVEMDYKEGTLVGLITNVIKTNRYFERAESVKEFEAKGAALFEQFPTQEWEYLVGNVRPLGVFNQNLIKRVSFPPSPGTKVRHASSENLKKFFKFDEQKGMHLGQIEHHDLNVNLNLTKLIQKHLAILAMSGAGKSYTVSVLFEELLKRKEEQGRIGLVVFDPHGEYSSFAIPPKDKKSRDFSDKTKIIKAQNIQISVPRLSAGNFGAMIPSMSSAQQRYLSRILRKLYSEINQGSGPYDLNKVIQTIAQDSTMKKNVRDALYDKLSELNNLGIFSEIDNPTIDEMVKPGQLTIVDMSDIVNIKKKQIIINYFSQKLFNERRKKTIPPFLMVLEEAHQFVPEHAPKETALCKSVIRKIAREGRKFGAALCLISQRPVHLDTTSLSQCNTQIILRVTNPNDLKHIGESSEGIDSRSLNMITSLQVGEALMVGEAVSYPMFFKIRKRESLPSVHEVPLEQAAIDFEKNSQKETEETLQFL